MKKASTKKAKVRVFALDKNGNRSKPAIVYLTWEKLPKKHIIECGPEIYS